MGFLAVSSSDGDRRRLPPVARIWLAMRLPLAGVVFLAVCSLLRADNIDDQLRKDAPRIIGFLKENKLSNVGVLRFLVQKSNEYPTFSAGPMNTNMVTRIENLLVLACEEKAPIRLLFAPGQVIAAQNAAQKSKISYLSVPGRRVMFELPYPAIGHDKPIAAEVFLTGRVEVAANWDTTTVKILAYRPKEASPFKVLEFTVPTDRSILADIGENFIIAKRGKGVDLDKAAIRSIKKEGLDSGFKDDKKPIEPVDLKEFAQFTLVYNNDKQKVVADAKKEKWLVPAPRKEHQVVMKIKNVTNKRIGVVLTVNGLNTVYDEEGDWRDVRKWVLDPEEEYTIKGYHRKNRTVAPFRVIPADQAGDLMDNSKVGQIAYAVFEEEPESTMKISGSLRGVMPWNLREKRPASFAELRGMVEDITGLKRSESGILQPDDVSQPGPDLIEVEFKNASFIGSRTIWYSDVSNFKKDNGSKEKYGAK